MSRVLPYALAALSGALVALAITAAIGGRLWPHRADDIRQLEQMAQAADARAERDSLHALQLTELAAGLQATIQEQDRSILQLMRGRDEAARAADAARAASDRLVASLPGLLRDAALTRAVSDREPDSAPAARQALAVCTDALNWCEATTTAQAETIARQDTLIQRGEEIRRAYVTRAALADSTIAHYADANRQFRSALSEQRTAYALATDLSGALARQNRSLRIQRGALVVGIGGAILWGVTR